jgi:outer membrane protein, heavy metal efflux system
LKKLIQAWLWLTVMVCASGCKHFEARPLSVARTANAFESRSLNDSGLRAFIATNAPTLTSNWPPQSWDLNLLTLAAFHYHPDLEAARAKVAAAEAAIITAGARPNPTLTFSPSYSEPPIEFFSPWTLGFTLDVPIETMGKRGYRIAQARYLANAVRLDVASAAWQVRSRVRSSLLEFYGANQYLELLTGLQAVQDQTVQFLENRLRAGQVTSLEVQLARVAAAQSALQLRDAQKQGDQARVRLADALGVPVNALTNISFSFTEFGTYPATQDAGTLRREALLDRADILGAVSEYNASQSALQLEIAKQYPDLNLGPGYTWNQGVNNYSLGLSLTLPVLDQNRGPIAEAEAHRRQASIAFTALQARVIREVDESFADYNDARRKLEAADALRVAAQSRLQSVQQQFDAGAADRVEVLQAQSEFDTSQLAWVAAHLETQQAVGLLEDAMQRPSETLDQSGKALLPAGSTSK